MKIFRPALVTALPTLISSLVLTSCSDPQPDLTPVPVGRDAGRDPTGRAPASEFTIAANLALGAELALDDRADFDDAKRGYIGSLREPQILDAEGEVVWDTSAYEFNTEFEPGQAPASVNPSLWRQAQINSIHDLFEVTDGVYQVRGYDLANMTLIAGDSGWIVIDPLTARETASASMALVGEHLGERPVRALIYTHSRETLSPTWRTP